MAIGVGAGGGECCAVPCQRVAGDFGFCGMIGIVNRQMQGIDLRAAVGIGMNVGIVTAGGVRGAIPSQRVTSGFSYRTVNGIINRQIKYNYTVTALITGECVWIIARCEICYPMPRKAIACSDGSISEGLNEYWTYGKSGATQS